MKEYIERDAVLSHKRKMRGFDLCEEFWDEAVLCEVIEKIPAADVAPMVHGMWIYDRTYYEADECYCSLCNQFMTTAKGVRMNYCPRCGAKMDGGKK